MRRFNVGVAALCLLLAGCSGGSHHSTTRRTPSSHPTTAHASIHAPAVRIAVTKIPWHLPYSLSREVAILTGTQVTLLGGLLQGNMTTARVVTLSLSNGNVASRGVLARQTHDAAGVLLNGKSLIFGGGSATQLAAVQEYANGAGGVVGQLPSPRSDVVAVQVNGTAYVIGGYDGHAPLRDVLATTDGHTFRHVGTLIEGVRYPAVAVANGAIYVFGGETAGGDTSLVQRVDLHDFAVTAAGHLPTTLAHAMAGLIGNRIVIAGGRRAGARSAQVLSYDPATQTVSVAGSLPEPVSDAGAVVWGNALLLFGGESPQPTSSVIRIGPS